MGEVLLVVVPAGGDGARGGPGGGGAGVSPEALVGVMRGGEFGRGPGADGGGESWVGGGLVVARAHHPVRWPVNPGGVDGVVAAVAGAQGAGADGLLLGLEPFPVRGGCGVVGVVVGGEVGQGVRQVGEWDAGQGGEVPSGARGEDEFGGRWRAVAGQGDAGAVKELGERQLVCVGETLDV
ncbi:hypothetical protein [Streptomyces sp. NPDC048611]|uniref:hypothetical protein n=1 Tax=Streptomyces sp. NPDC048611 TaxID=3155635 RepID=UPI0034276BB6